MASRREPPRVIPVPCPFGTDGTVYVYYIDAPEPALIDTGVRASPVAVIEPALAAAGVRLSEVRWLLATHGHWDHVGGLGAARQIASQARTAIHAADTVLLRDRARHWDTYLGVRFRYVEAPEALAGTEALLFENIGGEIGADRELTDGDRVDLGGGVVLRAVHTPGHTPGSASYVLDGPDWAFTGDAVQGRGSTSGRFPLLVDPVAYRASVRRLRDLQPARLFLGHQFLGHASAPFPAQVEGPAVADLLRVSAEMEADIARATTAGSSSHAATPTLPDIQRAAALLDDQLPGEPLTWPPALFTTLTAYLTRP